MQFDELAGFGEWPSARAAWSVAGSGSAVLNLAFSFDDRRYSGDDPDANASNAIADGRVYQQLAKQIADPNGVAFSVQVSLVTAPLPIAGANLALLNTWLTAITDYLSAVANGAKGTPVDPAPPADPTLTFPLASETLNTAQLFELVCSFTVARTEGDIEGEGIRSNSTIVSPDGAATATGLAMFATNLESALTQKGSAVLKVAADRDHCQPGAATSPTLWAVRVGLAPGQGIRYAIDDVDNPVIFAPKPISGRLISDSATIYPYVPGMGIDFNSKNAPRRTFANIDLDVWMRRIFATVDELLSPRYVSALLILDELTYGEKPPSTTVTNLAALLENKAQLTRMYAQQMTPVFEDQRDADNAAVAEVFRQSMLERLGDAYQTQAALEYEVDVVADIGEPPPSNTPPSLYGLVVQSGAPNPVQPGIALTPAKIPLVTATGVPLAFLVTTPLHATGDTQRLNVPLSLLYVPSHVVASSRLQFVNAPAPDPSDPTGLTRSLGSDDVPMLPRAYPPIPTAISQSGMPTFSGTLPPGALAEATKWTYSFTYTLPRFDSQDVLYGTVAFNVAEAMAPQTGIVDSFASMAQFVTVYPDIASDLESKLATITPKTTGDDLKTANVAIQSVNAMLGKITGLAPATGLPHAPAERFTVRPRGRSFQSGTDTTWSFTLNEAPYGSLDPAPPVQLGADDLVITVTSTSGPVPSPQITGYTANNAALAPIPGATTIQYYFTDTKGNVLTIEEAQSLSRTIQYPSLQILDKQDAQVSVHVTRNEHLVAKRTTNPDFVYQTAAVTFIGPCMPSILYTGPIDIALIAPTKPPSPRSLQAQLAALFDTLTAGASQSAMKIQLAVAYQYSVNPGGAALPVTVPILMQPPLGVFWGTGTPPAGDITLSEMIADLSAAIEAWFTANVPSSAGGMLLFSLTVMASLTQTTKPLLRLTDLQLELGDISPPLTVAGYPMSSGGS